MSSRITLRNCIRTLIILAIVAGFLWYVLFQSRLLIAGPMITLTHEPSVVQSEHVVVIEGMAENVVSITLNGRPIFVDEEGRFRQLLVLENGYTIMTIEAEDRYGRTTTLERPFVYSSKS